MDSLEQTETRNETYSSLSEIFDNMERVINYLVAKRRQDAMLSGVLAGMFVSFVGIVGLFGANILTEMHVAEYFNDHPNSGLVYFGFLLALSITIGFSAYFHMKRKHTVEFIPWKATLGGLRKAVAGREPYEGASIVEKTLQLMDQTSAWLPNLVKYKSGEAFKYGFLAWLLASWLTFLSPMAMPIGLLIGAMVWLYFTDKKRKEADQQITNLGAWKQKLEEGESNFLERV